MRARLMLLLTTLALGLRPPIVCALETFQVQSSEFADQLVFFFDARESFTTFLIVKNQDDHNTRVRIRFYGARFDTSVSREMTIPAFGLTLLDVGDLKASGLAAEAGVAIATGINDAGEPIVTHALSGNFTVANLRTQSAWGAPAFGRQAVVVGGETVNGATAGQVIGSISGTDVVKLRTMQPRALHLAGHYDPDSLAAPELGGNQLIFITFADVAGRGDELRTGLTNWRVLPFKQSGLAGLTACPATALFTAPGVTVSDLASVAGQSVRGQSGSMIFAAARPDVEVSRIVFFTESLGTFGTGYLLPPIGPACDQTLDCRPRGLCVTGVCVEEICPDQACDISCN